MGAANPKVTPLGAAPGEESFNPDEAKRLHAVTAALARAATTDEIADVIIREGIPALGARTGILGVLERPDELSFIRSTGYGDVFPARLTLEAPWPITHAVRSRSVVELRDVAERRASYDVPEAIWESSAHGTLVAVPLLVGDRAIGALGFTREQPVGLSRSERRIVEALANLAAHALDRAALHAADRRARATAEALLRVTRAVANAPSLREVALAVATEALAVLDASGVTIILSPTPGSEYGEVIASCGIVSAYASSEPRVNLAGNTVSAEAIRTGKEIFVESADDLSERWPVSAQVARRQGVGGLASIPMRVDGRAGALSVVVETPRRFEREERTFLELLARICEHGFARASLYEAQRDVALRLQRALLPDKLLRHPRVDVAAHYHAGSDAIEVGGDWFDVLELPGDRIGVAVGDVVGQGVEAAAAMGRVRSALAAYALHETSPAAVLDKLATFASGPNGVEFATAWYAILDVSDGSLAYASAGHLPGLVIGTDGGVRWLGEGRSPAFYRGRGRHLAEARTSLDPGASILLFSDGLVETRHDSLAAGLTRLEARVRVCRDASIHDLCERLISDLQAREEQTDDTVVVGLRLLPEPGAEPTEHD